MLGKMWYQAIAAGLSDYLKKNGVAAAAPKMPDDPIPVIQEF
ncbi:MAG: hypothetical protein M5R36_09420 [Deltaproteobacteria bacterium]|nr:hypothetical protein [Deltaproteobacteria bacterium]